MKLSQSILSLQKNVHVVKRVGWHEATRVLNTLV